MLVALLARHEGRPHAHHRPPPTKHRSSQKGVVPAVAEKIAELLLVPSKSLNTEFDTTPVAETENLRENLKGDLFRPRSSITS